MPDSTYLICFKHPFQAKPVLFIKHNKDVFIKRDVSYLLKFGSIISYDFSCIVDDFRKKALSLPVEIVDIQTAKKLVIGSPKSTFKTSNEPWKIKNILGKRVEQSSLKWLNDFYQLKMTAPENTPKINDIARDILDGFEQAWKDLFRELEDKAEKTRFFDIENPLYNIFLKTQLNGILVSKSELHVKFHELKTLWFSNLKTLELEYSFISQKIKMNMAWKDVSEYCKLEHIKDDLDYDFWKYAEIFAEYDVFLDALIKVKKSSIDYNALIKYSVDEYERIYPHFDILGTVTGRILISSPGIQYIKKTSRSIFKPKEGHVFLYADFDQFEPGIIASFSKDKKLIEIYNNGDIYEELSTLLFGDKSKRKLAKIIFLAFMYGMSRERLAKFIKDIGGEDAKEKGLEFFNKFKKLCAWKTDVCADAKKQGFSSSICGNRRYLQGKDKISEKEKRWIPNQIIQGTASYIFKKSLLEFREKSANIDFLIPMHDAILIELPKEKEKETKVLIKDIFIKEFKTICPEINANISFDDFCS